MNAQILDGKEVASIIKKDLKIEFDQIKSEYSVSPVLATVIVGQTTASEVYWNAQKRNALEMGVIYKLCEYPDDMSEDSLLSEIDKLNEDTDITGIMINMPLPEHIDSERVIGRIRPDKDAEGVHPENIGDIVIGNNPVAPCTASACLELIKSTKVKLRGKEVVCIGASRIVGKPIALMLLNEMTTVTSCHIATSERNLLESHVRRAEILVSAVGKSDVVKSEWIQKGAIVIDVGIHRVNGKLRGDIDFEDAQKIAGYISPVPGGVGPLTVAMLMRNILSIFKIQLVELNKKGSR